MTDRGIFGLLGVLAVIALVLFVMTPHEPGSTGEKVRDAVRQQVHETTDRLNDAFDAAKRDAQHRGNR